MNHFVCISFGVSPTSYSGIDERQVGTGHGHMVLVKICRDLSCFIIKEIEKDNKGLIIAAPIMKEIK